jgi:hypothetical protein
MVRKRLPAHLVTSNEVKRCSLCNKEFTADAKPSLSKAFAQHVKQVHRVEKPAEKKPA